MASQGVRVWILRSSNDQYHQYPRLLTKLGMWAAELFEIRNFIQRTFIFSETLIVLGLCGFRHSTIMLKRFKEKSIRRFKSSRNNCGLQQLRPSCAVRLFFVYVCKCISRHHQLSSNGNQIIVSCRMSVHPTTTQHWVWMVSRDGKSVLSNIMIDFFSSSFKRRDAFRKSCVIHFALRNLFNF